MPINKKNKDLKVLIIEDDAEIRANAVDLLELNGYKAFSAENGVEGVKLAQELLPDLIICDIMLPKKDGYEVKLELSKILKTKTIPFIYLSAKAEVKDIRYGMSLGADDYIVKPFKAEEFLVSVETRLSRLKEIAGGAGEHKKYKLSESDHIFVNVNDKQKFIKISDIKAISSNKDYSRLILTSGEETDIRKSLKEWEEILPENIFFRIHKSTIINIRFVEKTVKWFNRSIRIYLMNLETPFVVSERYAAKLKTKFSV